MLVRENGTPFCAGRSRYTDKADGADAETAKIFIKVVFDSLESPILAQLDTGAAWSILNKEIASELSLLDGTGQPIKISTRLGAFRGRLERTLIEIVADDGDALSVEATVFVSSDWPGHNFIGYSGLLERVKFAIDPSDNYFYFGSTQVLL